MTNNIVCFFCLVCLLLLFYSCQLLLCVLSIMSQFNIHPYYVYCVFTTGNYCVLHHVIYRHTRCNGSKGIVKFELIYKQQTLSVDDHLIIYIRAQFERRLTSYLLTLADLPIEPILWLFNHSKHATQVYTPNST